MDANTILALGLGVSPPWKLVGQQLDTTTRPHILHLEVAVDRGSLFACPTCGRACKAHDFAQFTWRHLNFFQHHCHVTAKVPRTDCPSTACSEPACRGRGKAARSPCCSSKRR